MKRNFNVVFQKELMSSEYKDYREYLNDCYNYVEMAIINYLRYLQSKIKGGEEESQDIRVAAICDLRDAEGYILYRINNTENKDDILAYTLKRAYSLNKLEWFSVIFSVMIEISEYRNFILESGVLGSDKTLSYDLFLKIFFVTDDVYNIRDYSEVVSSLREKLESLIFDAVNLSIDKNILPIILFNKMDSDGISGAKFVYPGDIKDDLIIREDSAKRIALFALATESQKSIYFYIHGIEGSGRKTIVKRASSIMNMQLVFIDLNDCNTDDPKDFNNTVMAACRQALIMSAGICIENFNVLEERSEIKQKYIDFVLNTVSRFSRIIFILSTKKGTAGNYRLQKMWIDIQIEELDKKESIALWSRYLDNDNSVSDASSADMANKFTFTPGQIEGTMEQARITYMWKGNVKLTVKELCECAYAQVVQNLADKATLIHSKHSWDQLVLEDKEKKMLKDACDQVRYKHIVYDEWGMKDRLMYGRGVSMLFAGPPGTGKTMAAQVIAHELGIDIYKVDLSKIVSKYIGETEKNLGSLFEEAKKSSVILFFDETDALFGKRTEVKDSHDKNANLETSYLLQKMEEYEGITIMTTNYLENIDKAFFRRISYVIHFAFPEQASRKKIWINMYPKKAPLSDDVDFDFLARQFEIAGGSIKNIVLSSAFMAAKENAKVNMKYIMKAAKYELSKQGKMMLKDDFGEYGYLLDD